ncbi:MAG: hypothetical protein MJ099_01985 [Clostridia bacterium]|nr:hypothetical protein [Clostridia bacterium]
MFRRLLPALIVILAFFLDTAFIPVFYYGELTFPLSLCLIVAVALMGGLIRGAVYGALCGVLFDATVGGFPSVSLIFMLSAILVAVLLNERDVHTKHLNGIPLHLRRAAFCALIFLIGELAMLAFDYYSTATISVSTFKPALIRILMKTVVAVLACPFFDRIFNPIRTSGSTGVRRRREVKHF